MIVFVYGTLRQGCSNHRLLANATYLAPATTQPQYTLLGKDAGYPYLVLGGTQRVRGELYEVDAHTLGNLDRLEGHPEHYQRQPIAIDTSTWGPVQGYAVQPDNRYLLYRNLEVIPSGDWMRQ